MTIINTKRSGIPRVMDLLRHLTLLTLQHNIYIRAVHIPGKHNAISLPGWGGGGETEEHASMADMCIDG